MYKREIWQNLIEKAWQKRSIIWLAGVRRSGKTSLCCSLKEAIYFDCELPSVRQQLEDVEFFLRQHEGKRLILDEIHRLLNPSEILKIAADHFPQTKVIATGSSSLSASSKFSDTLTGRKTDLWLTPMLSTEAALFENNNIEHRLQFGGLPPFFMAEYFPELEFSEWLSSFWAKDIQELFKVQKRFAFLKFAELLLTQSGSVFDAVRFTSPCESSRTAINNYLSILHETFLVHIIKPFNTHLPNEIIAAPKVYGFDSGFVTYANGWQTLRNEEKGLLWEHYVLNELQGRLQTRDIHYWRSKQQHEIDFIYIKNRQRQQPIAIECKWNANKFESKNIKYFRRKYPQGLNFVVAANVEKSFCKRYDGVEVNFVSLNDLIKELSS